MFVLTVRVAFIFYLFYFNSFIFLSFHKYGYFFGSKLLCITLTHFDVALCWIIHFSLWIFVINQLILNAAK